MFGFRKQVASIVFSAVLISVSLALASGENTGLAAQDTSAKFTIEQLVKFNGKNGNPAYVAVDSVVYDVTKVKSWKNGEHKKGIQAGNDVSQQILKSPHGKKVLKKLPVVGRLVASVKIDSVATIPAEPIQTPKAVPTPKQH